MIRIDEEMTRVMTLESSQCLLFQCVLYYRPKSIIELVGQSIYTYTVCTILIHSNNNAATVWLFERSGFFILSP